MAGMRSVPVDVSDPQALDWFINRELRYILSNLTVNSATSASYRLTTWVADVDCSPVSNVTLSGIQLVDGFNGFSGARVLVARQSVATENDIYLMSSGDWVSTSESLIAGSAVSVLNGVANGGKSYIIGGDGPWVSGVDSQYWGLFEPAAVATEPVLAFPHVFQGHIGDLWVGGAGRLVGMLVGDSSDVDYGIVDGSTLIPGAWKQISAGTTASSIVGRIYG